MGGRYTVRARYDQLLESGHCLVEGVSITTSIDGSQMHMVIEADTILTLRYSAAFTLAPFQALVSAGWH